MKTLVHAFITSRVDYCNAVLAGSPKSTTDTLQRVLNAAARLVTNTDKYDRGLSSLLHDQLHWLKSPSESSTSLLLWFAGVWRTKLRRIWATTAFRSPPSAADTYVQSTSINWLYRAVGELHSAIGLSLLQARWSGTHYRLSFAICVSVLVFFGALLRRYYSLDISAASAIEMYYDIVLYKFPISVYLSLYLSICLSFWLRVLD